MQYHDKVAEGLTNFAPVKLPSLELSALSINELQVKATHHQQ